MHLIARTLSIFLLVQSVSLPYSHASQDRGIKANVGTVITGGAYGFLAGTVSGLVVWPIYQSDRAIAVAAVIGMYLGFVVGIYYISNRDDPQNPLRRSSLEPRLLNSDPQTLVRVDIPVFRF
jgi:hypothetical protein